MEMGDRELVTTGRQTIFGARFLVDSSDGCGQLARAV